MRRLARSVFTVCGLAFVTACAGGGSGFSTGNGNGSIDSIVFSNGSPQANNFFVTPGGTSPLQINALGEKGSGPGAVVVPGAVFTWSGRFVDPATDAVGVKSYTTGPTPSGSKPCPARPVSVSPPNVEPPVPILQAILPTGFAALPSAQAAVTIYVGAVPGVLPPYCLLIQAMHVGDGVIGTKTVIVSSSP